MISVRRLGSFSGTGCIRSIGGRRSCSMVAMINEIVRRERLLNAFVRCSQLLPRWLNLAQPPKLPSATRAKSAGHDPVDARSGATREFGS